MFSLKSLILFGGIVMFSVAGYASWQAFKEDFSDVVDLGDPVVDLEMAKELALAEASLHRAVEFSPHSATEADLSDPYFEEYHFVYVWSEFGHAENSPFAVSREGAVFKLPEEFGQFARDADLAITSVEDARSLLEFYLELEILLPGSDSHTILASAADIPGLEGQVVELYDNVVMPMEVSELEDGWVFDFFTWRAVNGVLFHWEVTVSVAGGVQAERKEPLESLLGDYIMIE